MPINKSTNKFLKGLNTSNSSVNQAKDTYSYALNAIKEDSTNNPDLISNELGFSDYIDLGYNYILLGSTFLGKKDYILYIKNLESDTNKFNRIVLIENQTITLKLDTLDLNFNQSFLIKSTYRINYKNERIVYFVDGLNDDRVFNIDNNIPITNINQLDIDIHYVPAVLQSRTINDTNGDLLTGTYEFFGSYKSKDNAVTPWFILNATPIYVIESSVNNLNSSQYINVEGNDSGLISTKSIDLNIANLDTNFNKLRLGIIKTINGVSSAYYIDDISYNGSTKSYNYTGFASEIKLGDTSDFLVDGTKYYGSNAIAQSANRLLRANNKGVKINIDYQPYANNIVTEYYIEEEQVLSMDNDTTDSTRDNWWKSAVTKPTDSKSLMRDEVYSVGIAFGLIKEGVETEVYHIPGRQLNNIPNTTYRNQYNDSPTIPYSTAWDNQTISENGDTLERWKLINTAASSSDGTVNKLAYWESDETYPDRFGFPISGSSNNGINNTNIRHHKMPSSGLEPIYRTVSTQGNITVFKRNIGLSFTNIEVPPSLVGNVSYIRFYISPRDSEKNKSIVAKGAFINCSLTQIYEGDQHTLSSAIYVVPLQPYNDQKDRYAFGSYLYSDNAPSDPSIATTTNHYHSFYSPDTLLKNPVLNNDRVVIENELNGLVHYYDTMASSINVDPAHPTNTPSTNSAGYKRDLFYNNTEFPNSGQIYPTGFDQTDAHDVYNSNNTFVSTYKSICILNNITQVSNSKSRRKLKKSSYIPFSSKLSTDQIGNMDNPYYSPFGPSNVLLELDINNTNLGATEVEDTSLRFDDNDISTNHLENVRQYGDTVNGTFHFHPNINDKAVYRYGSLKVNNTSQYGQIVGLEYKPTDLLLFNVQFDATNKLIGPAKGLIGDTWIDMFSVKRCRYQAKLGYSFAGLPDTHVGVSSFFTESVTNHRLRYAEGIPPKVLYPQIVLNSNIKDYLNWNRNDGYIVTSDNYYKYNIDYTKVSTKSNYGINYSDIDISGIINYPTRIIYSNKLLNESLEDTYRLFLANNYTDIPKNSGSITNLFNKQQQLFAITRDSLWRLFSSTQEMRTTTDTIAIGTGDFLSQDPIEVVSIEGGFAGSSSKNSLVETPYGYLFVDRNKGKFILFDGSTKDLGLLGINNFIENNYELEILNQIKELNGEFDNPLCNFGYIVGYEPLNNRILVTKLDFVLTNLALSKYKGLYNPNISYQQGDIYLDNNIFHQVGASTPIYTSVYNTNNLSDFINNGKDTLVYNITQPNNGSTNISGSSLTYVPNNDYTGSDTFNVSLNCGLEVINVIVSDTPAHQFNLYINNNTSEYIESISITGPDNNTYNKIAPFTSLVLPLIGNGNYSVSVKPNGIISNKLIDINGYQQISSGNTVYAHNILADINITVS